MNRESDQSELRLFSLDLSSEDLVEEEIPDKVILEHYHLQDNSQTMQKLVMFSEVFCETREHHDEDDFLNSQYLIV